MKLSSPALQDENGEDFFADGRKILKRTEDGILEVESVEQRNARRVIWNQSPRS